ncbi:MAG: hypothetical protein JSV86_19050 [Gemmatimonadota bacterium]|nr:MAG: hypothetical protein JSV86_19050 [Gemmatimonadota bacterium]
MANALGKLKTATGPWLAAALIVVAAFMYWLYAASSSVEWGVVAADSLPELPRIADTTFVRNPEAFSGERILLSPVTVAERLGRATLTVDLPESPGYPLILDRPVVESEMTVAVGDSLSIAGSVYALTDSLLDVYVQRGFFEPENRERLAGQSTFFLVDSLDYYVADEETSTDARTSTDESGS